MLLSTLHTLSTMVHLPTLPSIPTLTTIPTSPPPPSVAASLGGRSLDTSMGFSPLEGLLMGVRAGDLDPTVVPYMAARLGETEAEVLRRAGEEGGFLGIAGTPDSKWENKAQIQHVCSPGSWRSGMRPGTPWPPSPSRCSATGWPSRCSPRW